MLELSCILHPIALLRVKVFHVTNGSNQHFNPDSNTLVTSIMLSSRHPSNGFTARFGGHRKIYYIKSRPDDTTKIDRLIDQLTNTIDILDYVNGIGNGRRMLNHAVHSYTSCLCWSDWHLCEGRSLDLGRRVGEGKSFFGEERSPVSTVARNFVRFVRLPLLSTRKVA